MLLLWVLPLTVFAAQDTAMQTVRIEVLVVEGTEVAGLTAHTRWLGRSRAATLVDDGTSPDAKALDETWTAAWTGAPVRMLPVRLVAECGKEEAAELKEVYAGLEIISAGDAVLSYVVNADCSAPATRVPQGDHGGLEADHASLAAYGGWMVAGLLLVAFATLRSRQQWDPPQLDSSPMWPWLLLWLLLAVAWTWPAALAGPHLWVGRHFDLPGTIWSISAIPRLSVALQDSLTGWPLMADYSRFDSYTMLPLGYLGAWVHPAALHGWIQVVGVAVSAWAAQYFARAMGARAPWCVLAGLAYGFSGVTSTALLEGHVYMVFCPWLPLFGLWWWRAMGEHPIAKNGAIAGMFFALAALTSAYMGLAAAVIAIGFFVQGALRHKARILRPAFAASAVVAPVVVGLMWVTASSDSSLHDTTTASIQLGAANLLGLLGPLEQIDFNGHSIAPTLSPILIGLLLVAPLMPQARRYRALWWTALAALVLSFGASIDADGSAPLMPSPMFWVLSLFEGRWYRFPVRMLWTWTLCAGVVGAVVLTQIAVGKRWLAGLILLAAVGHSTVAVRHSLRQRTHLGDSPSAYVDAKGPVLDLFPEGSDTAAEEEMWFSALACGYQVGHQQPIAENCVSTVPQDNTRNEIGRLVRAQLLMGRSDFVEELLASLGFKAVALHSDLFSLGDLDRIRTALLELGPLVSTSTDGGDFVELIEITAGVDRGPTMRRQRAAIMTAARDAFFTTHQTLGSILADLEGPSSVDRVLRIEVREEVLEAREIYQWEAEVEVDGVSKRLGFEDPNAVARQEEDLEFRWVSTWKGAVPGHFQLSVRGINMLGETQSEWTGDVYSRTERDRLVFAYSPDGLRPIVPTEALSAPLRSTDAGLIAASFWGVFASMCLWVWLLLRRQVRSEEE